MTARKREGCGRALRKSLGPFGPKCAKRRAESPPGARAAPQGIGVPPGRSQRLTAPTPCVGQTELPLAPMQPTLWSP